MQSRGRIGRARKRCDPKTDKGKMAAFGPGLAFAPGPEGQASIASSSSIKPSIIDRPLSQNAGSEASRPKGASNSL